MIRNGVIMLSVFLVLMLGIALGGILSQVTEEEPVSPTPTHEMFNPDRYYDMENGNICYQWQDDISCLPNK